MLMKGCDTMSNKPVFDYSKLSGRIKEKQKTREELRRITGIPLSTLSTKINNSKGNGYFSPTEIFKLSAALDIPSCDIGLYFFTPKV